jgi:hypothetical protein
MNLLSRLHSFNAKRRAPPARQDWLREFPKLPETKIPEGKEARRIKRLARDPVRFGKISTLKPPRKTP